MIIQQQIQMTQASLEKNTAILGKWMTHLLRAESGGSCTRYEAGCCIEGMKSVS